MSLPIFRSRNLKKHSQLQRVFLFENGRKQSIRLLDDRCQFGYSDLRKSLRSGAKFFEMDIFQRFKHEFLFQKLVFPLQFEIIIVVCHIFFQHAGLSKKQSFYLKQIVGMFANIAIGKAQSKSFEFVGIESESEISCQQHIKCVVP